jgi:hypothetical protein
MSRKGGAKGGMLSQRVHLSICPVCYGSFFRVFHDTIYAHWTKTLTLKVICDIENKIKRKRIKEDEWNKLVENEERVNLILKGEITEYND